MNFADISLYCNDVKNDEKAVELRESVGREVAIRIDKRYGGVKRFAETCYREAGFLNLGTFKTYIGSVRSGKPPGGNKVARGRAFTESELEKLSKLLGVLNFRRDNKLIVKLLGAGLGFVYLPKR